MDGAVIKTHRHHPDADLLPVTFGHDEIEREIFDKEIRVVLQALLIQSVQHRVAGAVSRSAGALHRRASAHVLHVPAKRALINRSIGVAAERHTGVLKLVHRGRGFARKILDRILIAQPVRPLDGVIHMPRPVIGAVVAQRGSDAALRSDRVATGREHLGNVGGAQAAFGRAHRGPQTRSARTHHHHIIGVIDNRVSALQMRPADIICGSACC